MCFLCDMLLAPALQIEATMCAIPFRILLNFMNFSKLTKQIHKMPKEEYHRIYVIV